MDNLKIPILLGTNRKLRLSAHVANWLLSQLQQRAGIESELFDVADFDLPKDDYGQEIKESFPTWRDAIVAADGLILVTPEYNHGYPGSLKSVLDLLLLEYVHKPVALVGVSAGPWGGTRVIESLVLVVRELGLTVTFTDLNFPRVHKTFSEDGILLDSSYDNRAREFFDELEWMARTLRWGRENVPSRFHNLQK